jgi:hypothetical protein
MTSKHTPFFQLRDALQQPGCALCRLGGLAAERFLDSLLYEYVNDPPMRTTVVAAHGFCPNHSRALVAHHDALGTSILYKAILKHLRFELDGGTTAPHEGLMTRLRGSAPALDARLEPHGPCPACVQRDDAVARALDLFAAHSGDGELKTALAASDGVCLPHLRAAASLPAPALTRLIAHQHTVWEALDAELAEAIRKHDFRHRAEPFGPEQDAWRRTVEVTAGQPGVF